MLDGYSFLVYVLEFFVDNLGDFFIFFCCFVDDILEILVDFLEYVFYFIIIFIGSIERMKNFYLRVKLVEVLEVVMFYLD